MAVTGSAKFMSLVTEFAATAADLGTRCRSISCQLSCSNTLHSQRWR
jgi:hypothetical protein